MGLRQIWIELDGLAREAAGLIEGRSIEKIGINSVEPNGHVRTSHGDRKGLSPSTPCRFNRRTAAIAFSAVVILLILCHLRTSGASHEAARVHVADWWCGSVATSRAGAAGPADAAHRRARHSPLTTRKARRA